MNEVGVELAEQSAEDCRIIELELRAGAALLVAPGGGQGLCRTFGTGRFAAQSVLSNLHYDSAPMPKHVQGLRKDRDTCVTQLSTALPRFVDQAATFSNSRAPIEFGPASASSTRTISPICASPLKCTDCSHGDLPSICPW